MVKEKKIFGADVNEEPKQEKNDGSADITAETSDELIAQLTAEAGKKSSSRKKKKMEEYKATRATREAIFSRLGQTIDIPIKINDEEIMIFTIIRLSEAENSEIIDRSLAIKNMQDMTEAELEESNRYNYKLLAKVVVEPKLSELEWEMNVDTALVQSLIEQIMKVLTNVDDSGRFDDFQV